MTKNNETFAPVLAEMMRAYNKQRESWIKWYGSESHFDAYFTGQVLQDPAKCKAAEAAAEEAKANRVAERNIGRMG